MKFMGVVLLSLALVMSLQAGKVVWNEDGSPKIAGTAGKGCMENGLAITEERNTTKANCS
jgi:hypothetical protein